ncbi:P-type Ca2+ transporter type 2C [Nematocida sp. AWRm80]|nr:P-type Ca2+ transporter type 2C [Nematocida sp. AWRm80]
MEIKEISAITEEYKRIHRGYHGEYKKVSSFEIDKTILYILLLSILSIGVGIYRYITTGTHSYIEGLIVLMQVAVVILFNILSEYKRESEMTMLENKENEREVKIQRGNTKILCRVKELQVGDRVLLERGDVIPGDLYLEKGSITCDESIITGECTGIEKGEGEKDKFLFSGSFVIAGAATGICILLREDTLKNKIKNRLRQIKKTKSPLQRKLEHLSGRLSLIGGSISAGIGLIMALREYYSTGKIIILEPLLLAVSLATIAIPEGLPVAVGISLAHASVNMYKDGALVRNVYKTEVMNSVTTICIDKTGTLTTSRMRVSTMLTENSLIAPEENTISQEMIIGSIYNPTIFTTEKGMHGSRTEMAILEYLRNKGIYLDLEYNEYISQPFCSSKKYSAIYISNTQHLQIERQILELIDLSNEDRPDNPISLIGTEYIAEGYTPIQSTPRESEEERRYNRKLIGRVYYKGGCDIILEHCTRIKYSDTTISITQLNQNAWTKIVSSARCIGIAYKEVYLSETGEVSEDILNLSPGLVLIGVFGLEDELREEIKEYLDICKGGKIDIKIVTGDGLENTTRIANYLNLLSPKDTLLNGKEFRQMPEEELIPLLSTLKILYRSTPEDKYRLVNILKSQGEIVCVTGDGTNDALALKAADVGFGMGSGSDIAKCSSDIVLLHDGFSSLVKTITWSRCINDNIRKFCQYQLTLTISSVILSLLSSLFSSLQTGLTATRLLWLNIIGDSLVPIALSSNRPGKETATRTPEPKRIGIITNMMKHYILFYSVAYIATTSTLAYLKYSKDFISNYFIFLQVFGLFTANTLEFRPMQMISTSLRNKILLGVSLFIALIQLVSIGIIPLLFSTGTNPIICWIQSLLFALITTSLVVFCSNSFFYSTNTPPVPYP